MKDLLLLHQRKKNLKATNFGKLLKWQWEVSQIAEEKFPHMKLLNI